MKKIVLVILFAIMAMYLQAEGLNKNATALKEISLIGYELIKAGAVDKWVDDHSMILYEINNQCDSAVEIIQIMLDGGDFTIFAEAVAYWSTIGMDIVNVGIIIDWINGGDITNIFNMAVDWQMVLYEYRKQLEASGQY